MRTKPSPYSPKPTPGDTATAASVSISFENSIEPSRAKAGGTGAQANMVAGGAGIAQPALPMASTSASRRLL